MFIILAVVILASAVFCVTTKRIMRAATALLFVLFAVAGLYFILDYSFLGAAQISIYAGGITMMYIFAIQLVDKNTLPGMREHWLGKKTILAGAISLVVFPAAAVLFLQLPVLPPVESLPPPHLLLAEESRPELAVAVQSSVHNSGRTAHLLQYSLHTAGKRSHL